MTNPIPEQLRQFCDGPIWDGNLIGKDTRDKLVRGGFVERVCGYNFLTKEGVKLCVEAGVLKS